MIFFEILLEGTSDVPVVKEILTRRFLLKEGVNFRIHPHLNLDQPKSPSLNAFINGVKRLVERSGA